MMDFSGHAGAGSDFDLLPKGLLVFAILTVQGIKTSATPSRYLEVELTVDQGQPFAGRKLWDKIGDPMFDGNSEKYRQMGNVAITRILEAGRNAGPHNPEGYQIGDYSQLSGLRVPIKVGIEDGTDGHDDKNRVAEWLTPNPASQSGHKGFQKLMNGDHGLASQSGATAASAFGGAPSAAQTNTGFGAPAGNAPGAGASGFGAAASPAAGNSGFGNTGFQQPPAESAGQSGAGATTAANQSASADANAARSNGQQAPGWLQQAGGAPQS
jgi:hypothetical protein